MSQLAESAKNTLSNAVASLPSRDAITASVSNIAANAQSTVAETKANLNSTLSDFSSKNMMNASTDFLNSNSAIAKFAFLVLLLIVFIVLLKLGVMILNYFMSPSKQPYLVKGLIRGNIPVTIPQDPANSKSPVVYRSNNQTGGIEFTWTTWILIDSLDTTLYKHSHIFNKGNNQYFEGSSANPTNGGYATVNNSPGLYMSIGSNNKSTNGLVFKMDAQNTDNTPIPREIEITNVPLQKWFHVAYRFQNYMMDCYVNGVLAKSVSFDEYVPKQNYDDVYLGQNGGFNGSLSNLRYYDYALSPFDIAAIVNYGPNLTASKLGTPGTNNIYDYLSIGWYSSVNQ